MEYKSVILSLSEAVAADCAIVKLLTEKGLDVVVVGDDDLEKVLAMKDEMEKEKE